MVIGATKTIIAHLGAVSKQLVHNILPQDYVMITLVIVEVFKEDLVLLIVVKVMGLEVQAVDLLVVMRLK